MLPVPYRPPQRYSTATPTIVPVFVHFLRAAVIMALEWTTLDFIEHAPLLAKIATFVVALVMLGIIESRDWLNFKGGYFLRSLLGAIVVWLLVVGYAAVEGRGTVRASSTTAPQNAKISEVNDRRSPATQCQLSVETAISLAHDLGQAGYLKSQLKIAPTFVLVTAQHPNEQLGVDLNAIFTQAYGNAGGISPLHAINSPNYARDIDAPKPIPSGAPNVTIHARQPLQDFLLQVLSPVFKTSRTESVPTDLIAYFHGIYPNTKDVDDIAWIEIGNGSPISRPAFCR